MRKADIIIITDKLHSTIYAIGTSPESNPSVFEDINYFGSRTYTPGYVLEIKDDGFAVVLMASHHPDSAQAKAVEADGFFRRREAQATPLEALSYRLADRKAHMEVLAEYSHWPLSPEQKAAKEAALAELKPLPKGWYTKTIRTTYIRMLWAEYQTKLDIANTGRKEAEAAKKAEQKKQSNRVTSLSKKLAALGVGYTKKKARSMLDRLNYGGSFYVPQDLFEKLVNGYGVKAASDVSETTKQGVLRLAQLAVNAGGGDSNDDEIQALQEALDEALSALGLTMPEKDTDEEDED